MTAKPDRRPLLFVLLAEILGGLLCVVANLPRSTQILSTKGVREFGFPFIFLARARGEVVYFSLWAASFDLCFWLALLIALGVVVFHRVVAEPPMDPSI